MCVGMVVALEMDRGSFSVFSPRQERTLGTIGSSVPSRSSSDCSSSFLLEQQ